MKYPSGEIPIFRNKNQIIAFSTGPGQFESNFNQVLNGNKKRFLLVQSNFGAFL